MKKKKEQQDSLESLAESQTIETNDDKNFDASENEKELEIKQKLKEFQKEVRDKNIEGEIKKQKKYKTKKDIEKEKQEFTESVEGVGTFILDAIIKRLPNPIPLTDQESLTFNSLFSRVVYKYADIVGNYQEETALGIITLMIIFPRLKSVKKEKNEA